MGICENTELEIAKLIQRLHPTGRILLKDAK
jgi:hypothetical protein